MFLLLNFHLKQLFHGSFSIFSAQDVVKQKYYCQNFWIFFILLYQHMVLSHLIIRVARFFKMWPEGLQILNLLKGSNLGEIFKLAGKDFQIVWTWLVIYFQNKSCIFPAQIYLGILHTKSQYI